MKGDIALWIVFAFLTAISLLSVYSSIGYYAIAENYTTPGRLFMKHVFFVVLSVVGVFVLSKIKYQYFKMPSLLLYALAMATSVVVLMMGSRWLPVGPVSFQPSEFLKLGTIMILAWHMSAHKDKLGEPKMMWWWLGISVISAGVIFGQNFSTAALLFLACLFMMLFAGANLKMWGKVFMVSFVLAMVALGVFYFYGDEMDFFRSSTWGSRINNWMHPNDELTQENMARMAIARGGIVGVGIGNTIHARLMTQACNDFIYAIIIEEMGTIVGLLVLVAYIVFFRRCILIVNDCKDVYGATLVAGIGILIFLQAMVNMSVAVGLLPVTGQTLPFVSYGGSSYLVLSGGMGVIQSVAHANKVNLKKEKLKAKENETEGIAKED